MGERRLTHLCLHGIGEPDVEPTSEEREYWITERHFIDVLDEVAGRTGVGLTFDDGYASDMRIALPALQERGLSATFFPIAAQFGDPGFMTLDDVVTLAEAGMTIGVHGWTHRVWPECTDSELVVELERSREWLYDITGESVTQAACPLGRYDRRVLKVLRRQGFTRVYTSDRAQATAGEWLQPRFSAHSTDTIEDIVQILDGDRSAIKPLMNRARLKAKRYR